MSRKRLPKGAEEALALLIEDHRRLSFLETHRGALEHSEKGWKVWVRGSAEYSPDFPCVLTADFATAREAISAAMEEVDLRRRERSRTRAIFRALGDGEGRGVRRSE
jgi:hypothetical protein